MREDARECFWAARGTAEARAVGCCSTPFSPKTASPSLVQLVSVSRSPPSAGAFSDPRVTSLLLLLLLLLSLMLLLLLLLLLMLLLTTPPPSGASSC